MSYFLRNSATVEDDGIDLHVLRPATELGYSGLIGPLPAHMTSQVRAWRALKDENMGEGRWNELARPRFTDRGYEPVLMLQALACDEDGQLAGPTPDECDLVFLAGAIHAAVSRERLSSYTDTPEWTRQVIGVTELADAWLLNWARSDRRDYSDFRAELQNRAQARGHDPNAWEFAAEGKA